MGTRTHPSLAQRPARGQPYLVTGSTSRAGGADGAGQTSETVFARSAVSTFGTGVALGEEDEGGLPGEVPSRGVTSPFAQQHRGTPGSSSSLGEAGTILLFPGSGGRAGLGSQLAAGDCPQGPRSDGDRGGSEYPLPWGLLPTSHGLGEHVRPRGGDGGGTGTAGSRGPRGDVRILGDTYSVTLGAWQAGSTTFSGHTLQTGGALAPGGTGSTSITLGKRERKRVLARTRRFPGTARSPRLQLPGGSRSRGTCASNRG